MARPDAPETAMERGHTPIRIAQCKVREKLWEHLIPEARLVRRKIIRELRRRDNLVLQPWRRDESYLVARAIIGIANEYFDWGSAKFFPEDDFLALFWSHMFGDLHNGVAIVQVEDLFEVRFPEDLDGVTFGEAVELIMHRCAAGRRPPRDSRSGQGFLVPWSYVRRRGWPHRMKDREV